MQSTTQAALEGAYDHSAQEQRSALQALVRCLDSLRFHFLHRHEDGADEGGRRAHRALCREHLAACRAIARCYFTRARLRPVNVGELSVMLHGGPATMQGWGDVKNVRGTVAGADLVVLAAHRLVRFDVVTGRWSITDDGAEMVREWDLGRPTHERCAS